MKSPFLDPSFMTQRERWLKDKCKHDLRAYAMKNKAHLLMNDPEIDEFCYDIALEESFTYVPIQLKTKAMSVKTNSWDIRCGFFRPTYQDQFDGNFDLRVDNNICGLHGGSGGIILQEFDEKLLEIHAMASKHTIATFLLNGFGPRLLVIKEVHIR